MCKVIYMASTLSMLPREEMIELVSNGFIMKLENGDEYLLIINTKEDGITE